MKRDKKINRSAVSLACNTYLNEKTESLYVILLTKQDPKTKMN